LLEDFGSIRHSREIVRFGLQSSDSLISALGAFFYPLISVPFVLSLILKGGLTCVLGRVRLNTVFCSDAHFTP